MSFIINFFSKSEIQDPTQTGATPPETNGTITGENSKITAIGQTHLTTEVASQCSQDVFSDKEVKEMTSSVTLEESAANEERALLAIGSENVFPSHCQKETTLQMAALAGLMYKDFKEIEGIASLFPKGLIMLPSPCDLGISCPKGLRVQAFRHGDEVIVAMRGTELNLDASTMLANLVADLGIGRHKTNEDLISSVREVAAKLKKLYGYDIGESLISTFESIVNQRITGDSDTERVISLGKEMALQSGKDAAIGCGIAGGAGGVVAGALVAVGMAAPPVAIALAFGALLTGSALGGSIGAGKTLATKGLTVADGYPTLQSYFKTLDNYITQLKATKIRNTDTLITTGHSLAGFLAGVIGFIHADEAFSFNGPGVLIDRDVIKTLENLGISRKISTECTYHSVVMEADIIGNLGKREVCGRKLYLPITLNAPYETMPACAYSDPLSHHGIMLMHAILENSTVHSIPKTPNFPVLLLKAREEEGPKVEEIND
ncbi:hypothetical protein [Estrella lausannensis]|uniref:Putative membrane protein n=1 Tax=Estrella lausannensis TaxID=483423 RepID=A0A0H5DRE5_9BACT|nr:hypothetical protein [Estrella lausannensis]CRX38249.1 putative membrane protein [Estrella lausannensis]